MNITPKPATVLELFEGHPERWTTKIGAKNRLGNAVDSNDNSACCWCIQGAYIYIYGFESYKINDKVNSCSGLHSWNDAPERTFEEVLAKVKELGI